ncbi:alpha/beta hydrolase [Pseudoroseomonas cervicalis]|uniref:alpha/beta hydrolase n=1 Tax=Teichococcus cervicalis TaxID=204525 RepID=UPI00278B8D98|nr:alpha/beta hydrolase [Pseudoroseomonas cervicalis]MDQ1077484.1 alpha/beta superfamily hydrolase [Pseudoroseomonas cervicalis]
MPLPRPETRLIDGPAGRLQLTLNHPAEGVAPRGLVLVSHPQPLLGGSPRHIVPHSAARRLAEAGWIAVRPSFRGVDGSEGEYAEGIGEAEDAAAIAALLRAEHPGLPLGLLGFSFGAHVYARLACRLEAEGAPARGIVLMGLPVGVVPGGRDYPALPIPPRTLLLHGEEDAMAPLPSLLGWGRATQHPVVVFPGADHFLKGCLDRALDLALAHLAAAA